MCVLSGSIVACVKKKTVNFETQVFFLPMVLFLS